MIWLTAAHRHATSWIHIDCNGLGTIVDSVAGTKYWVVCRQREGVELKGDLSSLYAFSMGEVDQPMDDRFKHEAVIIRPGSIL